MIYNKHHNIFSNKIYRDDEELSKLKFFMKRFTLANKAYWNILAGYDKIHSLTISPTKKCNLNCSYCITNSPNNTLEESFNLSVVDKAIKKFPNIDYIKIIGGEPLLQYREIIELHKKYPHLKLVICTNGVMLDKLLGYDSLIKQSEFRIGIEPPEFGNRINSAGKHQYDLAIKNISKIMAKEPQLLGFNIPYDMSIIEPTFSIEHFIDKLKADLNYDKFGLNWTPLYSKTEGADFSGMPAQILDELELLKNNPVKYKDNRNRYFLARAYFNLFITFYKHNYHSGCMGFTGVDINPNGVLHHCYVCAENGHEPIALSIDDYNEEVRRNALLKYYKWNSPKHCEGCTLQHLCSNCAIVSEDNKNCALYEKMFEAMVETLVFEEDEKIAKDWEEKMNTFNGELLDTYKKEKYEGNPLYEDLINFDLSLEEFEEVSKWITA